MVSQKILDDIIKRIVEVAQPEKIILFGSAAGGQMTGNSDVDLLIIKDGADPPQLTAKIYGRLHGVGAAVDAIVVSTADVERFKDSHALVIKPALQQGTVVYESALVDESAKCRSGIAANLTFIIPQLNPAPSRKTQRNKKFWDYTPAKKTTLSASRSAISLCDFLMASLCVRRLRRLLQGRL